MAFMFIKPHANTDGVRDLVREELERQQLRVVKSGTIGADRLGEARIVDTHFGSVAKKALDERPQDTVVQPEAQDAFRAAFGQSWQDALGQGRVCNAGEAMARLNCTEEKLDEEWTPLQIGRGKVKFGGGFYCGRIKDLYVINGFYMAMRGMYTKLGCSVRWFTVEWQPEHLSWEDFRGKVLGATDPALAARDSLRGAIHEKWRQLSLPGVPHVGENSLHASASALEALLERMNWLGIKPADDPFGRALLGRGVTLRMLQRWSSNPDVAYRGREISIFDLFENLDSQACLDTAAELARPQS